MTEQYLPFGTGGLRDELRYAESFADDEPVEHVNDWFAAQVGEHFKRPKLGDSPDSDEIDPRTGAPVGKCPECGEQAESSQYMRRGVLYVDQWCPYCEWRDIDEEGGEP